MGIGNISEGLATGKIAAEQLQKCRYELKQRNINTLLNMGLTYQGLFDENDHNKLKTAAKNYIDRLNVK
jgi:hypothetical protein